VRMAKPKRCRVCREEFTPFLSTAVVCSAGCWLKLNKRHEEREYRKSRRKIIENRQNEKG
jgi:hypothetical protein